MSGPARFKGLGVVVALLLLAAVPVAGWALTRDEDSPQASTMRDDAQQAMTSANFRLTVPPCEYCAGPTVVDFAPPDRFHVRTPGEFEQWPHSLYIDRTFFVSTEGRRWIETTDARAALMLSSNPRFLLPLLERPAAGNGGTLGGRNTFTLRARIDLDAYMAALPPALTADPDTAAGLRSFAGGEATLWIDRGNARVVKLHIDFDHPERPDAETVYEYVSSTEVPATIDAMPEDEAQRLGGAMECSATQLLFAIGAYQRAHGAYPPELSPAVLGLTALPPNPFSGQPMAHRPGAAGDFEYQVADGSQSIQFSAWGWDGVHVYYDSARFGPVGDGPPKCLDNE